MRKIIFGTCMLILCLLFFSCSDKNEGIYEFTYDSDSGTYSITAFLDEDAVIVEIPLTYKNKKITKIKEHAFFERMNIKKVIISDNIVEIEDAAFFDCQNINYIHIGQNVKYITGTSFLWSNLSDITINPDNPYFRVTFHCLINKDTKALIIGTNQSSIPDGITEISENAFCGRRDLDKIVIRKGCKIIKTQAFAGCEELKTVVLPESIEIIEDGVFAGCYSLKKINIPNKITKIPDGIFIACLSLETVIISDQIKEIGCRAFINCDGLSEIYIPKNVEIIESNAFATNTKITIYCEASEEPKGWQYHWTSTNNTVIWGYNFSDITFISDIK